MNYPVFTQQEFIAGLNRLGVDDTRKLLRTGAIDGEEARWATDWLAQRLLPDMAPARNATPEPAAEVAPEPEQPVPYKLAS